MIYKIVNGQKILVADVSKVKSVNGLSGNVWLDANNLHMISGTGPTIAGVLSTISGRVNTNISGITALSGGISGLADDIADLERYADDISGDLSGLQTDFNKLDVEYEGGNVYLTVDGEQKGSGFNIDIDSAIEYAGIHKYNGTSWEGGLSGIYTPLSGSFTAGGSYLILAYEGTGDNSGITITTADVADLVSDYEGISGITIDSRNISLNYGNGLALNGNQVYVSGNAASGIVVNAGGVSAVANTDAGITINASGIAAKVQAPNIEFISGNIAFDMPVSGTFNSDLSSLANGFYIDLTDAISGNVNASGLI